MKMLKFAHNVKSKNKSFKYTQTYWKGVWIFGKLLLGKGVLGKMALGNMVYFCNCILKISKSIIKFIHIYVNVAHYYSETYFYLPTHF